MASMGPITNTRTLKGALVEAIDHLERAGPTPKITRMLQRCREYSTLVNQWDGDPPPADEQFEAIGQIMQLLGAAMNATKGQATDHSTLEVHEISPIGDDAIDFGGDPLHEDGQHDALDLVPASPHAQIVDVYRLPWRDMGNGVFVKTLRAGDDGRDHALVRLENGAKLPGLSHTSDEHMYVIDGCIRHAGAAAHAGACIRMDSETTSGTITAFGESTILLMDSERAAIKL